MTPADIKTMIESVGIPSEYYQFPEGTAQECPFLCYFFTDSTDLIADNVNYARIEKLHIELYTDVKDFALEATLEGILNNYELAFDKESTFLDDEHMHETIYTTDVLLEVTTNGINQ